MTSPTNLLGLDIGERRIGVARVNLVARLPQALTTLSNDDSFVSKLKDLIKQYQIDGLVVGLPRNLKGEETAQSGYTRHFSKDKLTGLGLPIIWQDETLSSVAAAEDMNKRKLKSDNIDALAAEIILDDYLSANRKGGS
jgi:putative Holliday junction resolvase